MMLIRFSVSVTLFSLLSSTDLCTDGTFEDLLHVCNEKKLRKKLFEKSQGYKLNSCFLNLFKKKINLVKILSKKRSPFSQI